MTGLHGSSVWCPWCREYVHPRGGYSAHIKGCQDAPPSVKAAYAVDPYPPAGVR